MKKRKKRNPTQIAWDRAWRAFSDYIRQRDRGICVTCGTSVWDSELGENDWKAMQAGHFRHGKFDFNEMNVNCQCVRCNKWLHGNGSKYRRYLQDKYSIETVNDLEDSDEISDKRTAEEWLQVEEEYRAKIAAKDWL